MEGTVVVLSKEECIEGTDVPFLKDLCSWEVLWGFYCRSSIEGSYCGAL